MALKKGGFLFKNNFDVVMGLINADMLEHNQQM